jgi:predicted phosphodiesterase
MLRIISDLHLFDGACRVRELRQLDPLIDGVDALLINGDSCDTQVCATADQIEEMRSYFAARAPEVTFVTGNHDPNISDVHEQLLAEGRIWATHGDVLFPDATPWSKLLPEIRRRIAAARAREQHGSFGHIETRLRIFRQISHGLPIDDDLRSRDFATLMRRVLYELGHPLRLRAVLRAWKDAPELAAALASEQRSTAQIAVFGHIHRPSITQRNGRVIINTGAFSGPLGALAVDVHDDLVRVRTIEFRRGEARLGGAVSEIPLATHAATRLTRAS